MEFTPAPHITQNWQLAKPAASGRRGMVVSQSKRRRRGRRRGARCRRQRDRCGGRDRARARRGRAVEFRARRHRARGGSPGRAGARRDGRFRPDRAGRARSQSCFKLTGRDRRPTCSPGPEVEGDINIHGPLSFAIPSAVAGYERDAPALGQAAARRDRGARDRAREARAAGGLVHVAEGRRVARRSCSKYPESARIYLRDGLPPMPPYQGGFNYFRLGRLPDTLERLAQAGWRDFYEGEIAASIVADVKRAGRRAVGGGSARIARRACCPPTEVAWRGAHAAALRPAHRGADRGRCVAPHGGRARSARRPTPPGTWRSRAR